MFVTAPAGAVGIILAALNTHKNSESVVAKLAYAVDALAQGSQSSNRTKLAQGDIVEVLLTAMSRHERSAAVVGVAQYHCLRSVVIAMPVQCLLPIVNVYACNQ